MLSACGGRDRQPDLLNIRASQTTPDEFGILPTKPLEVPESYAALPEPTPGGRNRVDPTPHADAVAALGGNPAALNSTGIPASDGALYNHVTRSGVTPAIRQTLAAEDLEYRRKNDGRLLERWFNVNVYYKAYRPMSLDQHVELERWRLAGARTPSAPPDPALEE
jgi:hypothetical protein